MKMGLTGLRQVCIVTWDLERAERCWSQILGISAARLKTPLWEDVPSYTDGMPDGFFQEEFLLYRLENDVIIEIFGPGKHPGNPWRKHLEKHGEGVMNLAFYVDDERSKAYQRIGTVCEAQKPYHEGFYPDASYTFVDTMKELGVELNIKRYEDNTELIKRLVSNPSCYEN